MLDPRLFETEPERVRDTLLRRHADPEALASLERVAALNARRRELVTEGDRLRSLRNELSPRIGALIKAGQADQATALREQVNQANDTARALDAELAEVERTRDAIITSLPNLLDDQVPTGKGDEDNVEVRRWGSPRELGFPARTHDELGEALGILDFNAAARMAGARFSVLRGAGAQLERALVSFFLDLHTREHGYTEVVAPYIVWRSTMEGTGQLPKFEQDMFRLAQPLNGQDAFLIPTAEVPITNLHRGELLDESQLPLAYVAFTPCFRAEAGSYGKDTRGLIRQHQFHKVELVRITSADTSDAEHELLTQHAEVCLQRLGLPYRVMRLCSGDIGFGARHCYDLEVWLPGQGRYREISSCSNCGDFQARRMDTRYRPLGDDPKKKPKPRLVHTLNGSGLAVGRTLLAILENYQQADGSIEVPLALRPYMGGLDRIGGVR